MKALALAGLLVISTRLTIRIASAVFFVVLVSFSGANALARCSFATLHTYQNDSITILEQVAEQDIDESDAYAQFNHLLHKVHWCINTASEPPGHLMSFLEATRAIAVIETLYAEAMGAFGNLSQGRSEAQYAMRAARSMMIFAPDFVHPQVLKQWSDSLYYSAQRVDKELQHEQVLRSIH